MLFETLDFDYSIVDKSFISSTGIVREMRIFLPRDGNRSFLAKMQIPIK